MPRHDPLTEVAERLARFDNPGAADAAPDVGGDLTLEQPACSPLASSPSSVDAAA